VSVGITVLVCLLFALLGWLIRRLAAAPVDGSADSARG